MESKAEPELNSNIPTLPLFSVPPITRSPEHSGMLTPPLHTSASVPFRWEEEPGKPRPCTALIPLPNTTNNGELKSLELPPRLFFEPSKTTTKTPSPTTVLDGPYIGSGRRKFTSSSFRIFRERHGSFDSTGSASPERSGQLSTVVLGKTLHKKKGLFGSWRYRTLNLKGTKKDVGGGSFVFPAAVDAPADDQSSDTKVKISRIRRNGSFSNLSQSTRSHFWAAVYKGLKHAIPWKSRRSKKDGLIV